MPLLCRGILFIPVKLLSKREALERHNAAVFFLQGCDQVLPIFLPTEEEQFITRGDLVRELSKHKLSPAFSFRQRCVAERDIIITNARIGLE